MPITELTNFQFETCNGAANGTTKVVVLMCANQNDSPEKADKLNNQLKEMSDLIALGLFEEVSDQFQESINTSKINNNRDFKVFAITKIGYDMFEDFEERVVN